MHQIAIKSKLDAYVCTLLISDGWLLQWTEISKSTGVTKLHTIKTTNDTDPNVKSFCISSAYGGGELVTFRNQEYAMNHIWRHRKHIHKNGGVVSGKCKP